MNNAWHYTSQDTFPFLDTQKITHISAVVKLMSHFVTPLLCQYDNVIKFEVNFIKYRPHVTYSDM